MYSREKIIVLFVNTYFTMLELDDETIEELEHVMKYFDVTADEVLKLGIKISRRFTGEAFRNLFINSVKKKGSGLWNIIEIGKELYFMYIEKTFRRLRLKTLRLKTYYLPMKDVYLQSM